MVRCCADRLGACRRLAVTASRRMARNAFGKGRARHTHIDVTAFNFTASLARHGLLRCDGLFVTRFQIPSPRIFERRPLIALPGLRAMADRLWSDAERLEEPR